MPNLVPWFLGISSLMCLLFFLTATSDISHSLSPQGCRMSWMSPSYVLQGGLDSTWTPLARRYSLWLYREVGWDYVQETGQRRDSLPVLFIPGNAGSSHQVRSIASSATRQYFSSPYIISHEFDARSLKPLDFFAVEFNEDLSAFHGSTLDSQIAYTSRAVSYILSLYPKGTKIIVMGHSMGGVVATSLLPDPNISTIITMSTPHTLPPARFDSRIDKLYNNVRLTLENDTTPVVSICGGATDMMITSESCILPEPEKDVFRRTVFTSALEGAWTGVGHREMVWCHQVRWRVARAALELGAANTEKSRSVILDKWLRDGHSLPPVVSNGNDHLDASDLADSHLVLPGQTLVVKNPRGGSIHRLPVPSDSATSQKRRLRVLVSQGSIQDVSPQHPVSLRVSVLTCTETSTSGAKCTLLSPDTLKLIPNPMPGRSFPVPKEGSDESEGVVLFESSVPVKDSGPDGQWVGIRIENGDDQGWVVAGIEDDTPVVSSASTFSLMFWSASVNVPPKETLGSSFTFPSLLSNALVVYRVVAKKSPLSSCSDALLPPLIVHTSHPAETHSYPLISGPDRRILLHTHSDAPFIDRRTAHGSSLAFRIYSSGEQGCRKELSKLVLTIDWTATVGRWVSRYLHTVVGWAAGVASLVIFWTWRQDEKTSSTPSVGQSLASYCPLLFRYLLPGSFALSFLPLPPSLYIGNKGVPFFSGIAPLILFVASGLVCVSWWILLLLLTIVGKTSTIIFGSRVEKNSVHRGTLLSLFVICLAIFLFVPWQVAYLGCWLLHLYTCASAMQRLEPTRLDDAVPLVRRQRRESSESFEATSPASAERATSSLKDIKQNNLNHSLHLLLLMTWLLPLTAPVLAVWVRTLLTAGFTTPFDGDHNFIAVLPFLVLVDFASWTPGRLFERTSFENRLSLRWLFAATAGTAFLYGSRRPYLILDVARVTAWAIVVCRIGRRYWGGRPWPGATTH
ncbi:unnamed protein product [Cyclocybe aegerita]|uniref:GPI inositol-deacylase n=1 Tax=Cyclocybe aegerita TaxID=1973307 RepID=A0A8S0W0Z7_CYCAE|nr:unnamed protein product [Cyclocybe aegerita]